MGYTFYGANGKTFARNVYMGDYLAKITLGLWSKIGCYPKSEEDCKLVARILRNRIHLNEYHREYYEEIYEWKKLPKGFIKDLEDLANFFETCGGCLKEEEWYGKYTLKIIMGDIEDQK